MVKDIKKLLLKKQMVAPELQTIVRVLQPYASDIQATSIQLHEGLLSFHGVSGPARMNILLKKKEIKEQIKQAGVHVRDII